MYAVHSDTSGQFHLQGVYVPTQQICIAWPVFYTRTVAFIVGGYKLDESIGVW